MTSREKAKELIDKFKPFAAGDETYAIYDEAETIRNAKQCAIIAVEEIIDSNPVEWIKGPDSIDEETKEPVSTITIKSTRTYWQSVKEEIIKHP